MARKKKPTPAREVAKQERRRSGAAGPHANRRPRSTEERNAIDDAKET